MVLVLWLSSHFSTYSADGVIWQWSSEQGREGGGCVGSLLLNLRKKSEFCTFLSRLDERKKKEKKNVIKYINTNVVITT